MKKNKNTLAREKRNSDLQTTNVLMKTIEDLKKLSSERYHGSGLIITITDLSGEILVDAAINGEIYPELHPCLIAAFVATLKTRMIYINAQLNACNQLIK